MFDSKAMAAQRVLADALDAALVAAYEQGVADGIQRIVAAAQGVKVEAATKSPLPPILEQRSRAVNLDPDEDEISADGIKRVRRGLVQETLIRIMAEKPGLAITDYEKLVAEVEPEISYKSIGNELRRYEGSKYKRDREGGNRWFPIDYQFEEAGDAQPSGPASSNVPFQLERG